MKNTLRIFGIFAVLVISLSLSACSPRIVNSGEIQSEIISQDIYLQRGFEITDYTEVERKTIRENRCDIVRVNICAENDYAEYMATYYLNYYLYDNGWLCDLIKCEDSFLSAKSGVNEELVVADVLDYFSDFFESAYCIDNIDATSVNSTDPRSEYYDMTPAAFVAQITASNKYAKFDMSYYAEYMFDPFQGWIFQHSIQDEITYEPLSLPERTLAEQALKRAATGEISYMSGTSTDNNRYQYVYRICDDSSYKYLTMNYTATVSLLFEYDNGWKVDDVSSELSSAEFKDVEGAWIYDDGKGEQIYNFMIVSATESSVSYIMDVTLTDSLIALPWSTYSVSSDGETYVKSWSKREGDGYILKTDDCVAGREFGLGNANYYYLEFHSYSGSKYNKSGFYLNEQQLVKQETP